MQSYYSFSRVSQEANPPFHLKNAVLLGFGEINRVCAGHTWALEQSLAESVCFTANHHDAETPDESGLSEHGKGHRRITPRAFKGNR